MLHQTFHKCFVLSDTIEKTSFQLYRIYRINYKFIYIHIIIWWGFSSEFNLSNEQREITLISLRLEMILVRKDMDVNDLID